MTQATIQRGQIAPVALPTEIVDVPAIGGSVRVQGMNLPQLLAFRARSRRAAEPVADETPQAAAERVSGEMIPALLAECVVLDDGAPVYSAAEWAIFGTQHPGDALAL